MNYNEKKDKQKQVQSSDHEFALILNQPVGKQQESLYSIKVTTRGR